MTTFREMREYATTIHATTIEQIMAEQRAAHPVVMMARKPYVPAHVTVED